MEAQIIEHGKTSVCNLISREYPILVGNTSTILISVALGNKRLVSPYCLGILEVYAAILKV